MRSSYKNQCCGTLTVEPLRCLRINCPAWFSRDDFLDYLEQLTYTPVATWHPAGETPGSGSDVFLTHDHGEGSDKAGLPDDIWEHICRIADQHGLGYGVIWLTNRGADESGPPMEIETKCSGSRISARKR